MIDGKLIAMVLEGMRMINLWTEKK